MRRRKRVIIYRIIDKDGYVYSQPFGISPENVLSTARHLDNKYPEDAPHLAQKRRVFKHTRPTQPLSYAAWKPISN